MKYKYRYDAEADILVITLSSEKPDFGEEQNGVIFHYNKKGKPVEMEILDASEVVADLVKAVLASKKIPA